MNNNNGFGAVITVLIVSSGTMAISMVALGAAISYSDVVFRRELRIQSNLDSVACNDTATLIKAKDMFVSGKVHISEFNCDVKF